MWTPQLWVWHKFMRALHVCNASKAQKVQTTLSLIGTINRPLKVSKKVKIWSIFMHSSLCKLLKFAFLSSFTCSVRTSISNHDYEFSTKNALPPGPRTCFVILQQFTWHCSCFTSFVLIFVHIIRLYAWHNPPSIAKVTNWREAKVHQNSLKKI